MKKFCILLIVSLIYSCNEKDNLYSMSPLTSEILEKSSSAKTNCEKLDVLDAEMQNLLQKIKIEYRTEDFFEKRFEMSQVYWIQYRDRHIKSLFPKDWNTFYRKEYGKDEFNECKCDELSRMTIRRIEELAMYLENGDGKDCPSIWNKKALK